MASTKGVILCVLFNMIICSCYIIATESRYYGGYRIVAKTWCIANPLASPAALQRDIDSLCNGIVDCSSIQPGGSCYNPNTVADHASVALNLNYKNHQSQQQFCTGDGFITVSNP
ncbi:hypothetical protein ZIOFF_034881 [Zingiber officinale]|uniref:X8 domain-containing protein n=1 Tax=Zingiber officinale TaxID=94328 RepID=A0A8J5G946_ZINOF|nr:hypothetical protein ZIOFF_034881 [Zingiber officinale]